MARKYDGPAHARRPLLFDGATGTELERANVSCAAPIWSAQALLEAPGTLRQIHQRYLAAGVDVVTANTFRTQARVLAGAGLADRAASLTRSAVEIARDAVAREGRGDVLVVGSAPPLGDCYKPAETPDDATLARDHAAHAENLAEAGVDEILAETHITVREALAASRAAAATGLPCRTTFVADGQSRLLSGESLATAIETVAPFVVAVGVNCLIPTDARACLPTLAASGVAFGVQANLGAPGPTVEAPRTADLSPRGFADEAMSWADAGACFVGGCCGTTPAHLAAVALRFRGAQRDGRTRPV